MWRHKSPPWVEVWVVVVEELSFEVCIIFFLVSTQIQPKTAQKIYRRRFLVGSIYGFVLKETMSPRVVPYWF